MADWLQVFTSSAEGRATRSTALQPLLWLTGLLLAATTGAGISNSSPNWLIIVLASFAGLSMLVVLGSFVFFAQKNPDALRSEKYLIRRMEIEQSSIGDSDVGILQGEMKRRLTQKVTPKAGEDQ